MDQNQLEKITVDYQKVQEQLQALSAQKEQFSTQKDEYKQAKEQIEKATGKIYSAVGGAIIETTKEEALKEIQDKDELIDMRLSMLKKQIDELKKKDQELREQITSALNESKK
ncbi:prefoldin subunit [Candidatus Marsarchaeota archaeon]|nr:prefoldin subunit [Candidatus Marsarchaeota archaeon]MCL5404880.1 prefoldin subunit [Candidatus Marsarchaeota archaeon]